MATVISTTFATPLVYPATSRIDRANPSGNLYVLGRASTADLFELWRSTNSGGSWSLTSMTHLTRANVQEWGSLIIYEPFGFTCYRTNEGGQDRIYYRRFEPDRGWHAELLVAAVPTGGFIGGLDMQVVGTPYGIYVAIGVGVTVGGSIGMQLFGVYVDTYGAPVVFNDLIAGTRSFLTTGSGRVGVSLDIEHQGDPHSAANPHLWCAFGRTNMYSLRCAWNGYGWNPPSSAVKLNPTTLSAQDQMTGRWDGARFVTVAPDPVNTSTVAVYERNASNSSTAIRQSQVHPTGVVRNCSFNYNEVTRDIRVYAIGTSTQVLYFCDYIRATNTWSAWSTVTATAILGATGLNYSPRRGSRGARYDILTAHSGAPNTVVHIGQSLSYPPNAPLWDTASMGRTSGGAADVASTLLLDWTFSDPDPADTQNSYALSRQIGAGALAYWRASDSTWQVAEVQNATATTAVTLPSAWGVHTDAATQFRVKVWDSAVVASPYGDPFVVIPSQKVNPSFASPAPAAVITDDTITPTWTVSEQTAYRLTLTTNPGGLLTYDSGWVTAPVSTLSALIPVRLPDLSGWTIGLTTRNNEGLQSNTVTVSFTVDFLEPPAPMVTAVPSPGQGVIIATAVNAAVVGAQPVVVEQDVYRRPVASANVLANPSFAVDTTGWAPTGATMTRTNAQSHSADGYSVLLTPDGVTVSPRIGPVLANRVPIVEGQSITADGWVRPTTANKPIRFGVSWYNSGGAFLAASLLAPASVAGAWLYCQITAAAPAGTASCDITVGLESTPAAGDTAHIDDLRMRYTDASEGVRIAAGLASGGQVLDWGPIHGTAYEYRSVARGANGSTVAGPWIA